MADQTDTRPDAAECALAAAPALAGMKIADEHRSGVLTYLRIGLARADAIGPVGPNAAPTFRA